VARRIIPGMNAAGRSLRQVHLDFHTPGNVTPIAEAFDAATFAETMRAAHVGSVNVFARCHHGYSYYPTRVGTMHPGLGFDLLGAQIEALHGAGIAAVVYVTIGWDDLAGASEPGWVVGNRDGTPNARRPGTAPSITGGLSPDDGGPGAPRWSLLDPSTAYGDYICDQVRELCDRYRIDGFWFDICLAVPNYSTWGLAQMAAAGVDPSDEAAAFAFARRRELAFLERVSRLVYELAPGATVFYNGTTDAAMGETVRLQSHLDLESLATSPGLWGYLHYPMTARHARTMERPFTGMTGRFHKSWADFGGLKTLDQLEYECGSIMAAGGGVFVGDQLHPSGRLDPAVYRLIGRVFERIERLEPWLVGARSVAEVAIVSDPRTETFGGQPATAQNPEVEGAAQIFLESAVQFDIVDPVRPNGAGADFAPYRLVVLPDGLAVGTALRASLDAHLARGGALLASGTAALGSDGLFVLDAMPVEYVGPGPTLPAYFRVDDTLAAGSELATDYDYVLYDRPSLVRAREGAVARGSLAAAMFERTAEHFFSHAQAPVGKALGAPLAVLGGRVGYLAAPLFRAYRDHDYWPYAQVVGSLVRDLLPDPLVHFAGPPWIEVGVLRQDGDVAGGSPRWVVHLVAYHPRRTAQSVPHVDHSWPTAGCRIGLRIGPAGAGRAYLAPEETDVPISRDGDYVWLDLPPLGTHTVLVVEPR
jgi:hypothetical protein